MDEKDRVPHPSEALEFVSIAPTVEDVLERCPRSGSLATVLTRNASAKDAVAEDSLESYYSTTIERSTTSATRTSKITSDDRRDMIFGSKAAMEAERRMTLKEGLRMYPKAIAWSAMLSLTLVMEGYDLSLINGFFAFPEFRRRYGHPTEQSGYQISTAWQSALTNGAVVGEILGLLANGMVTERFGYRKTLVISLVWLSLAIFLSFFAFNIGMLMAAQVLCGLSWGVFQTLSTTYAAEVMPVALRAYLTSNVNLCWLIGQLTALGALRGTVEWENQWSYRVPFGLQWMYSIAILVGVIFAPESPWWLVRHGRLDETKRSLERLTSRGQNFNADETIAMMRHTNEIEKDITAGVSYWDCFKGIERRRTEIACMVWVIQTLSGSPMTGYATYFFNRSGLRPELAFDLSVGMYGIGICGHVLSLFLMRYVGRRPLYIWGCALSCGVLMIAGGVGTLPTTTTQSWALGALVCLMTFIYDTTVGPVCYSLVSELPSTRLRVKTVILARIAYNIVGIVSNVLMPRLLNPLAWNVKGLTCFVWAGTALFSTIWCYWRLPEPKGLTYMELDLLFQKGATPKKFKQVRERLASSGYFSIVDPKDSGHNWHGVKS